MSLLAVMEAATTPELRTRLYLIECREGRRQRGRPPVPTQLENTARPVAIGSFNQIIKFPLDVGQFFQGQNETDEAKTLVVSQAGDYRVANWKILIRSRTN